MLKATASLNGKQEINCTIVRLLCSLVLHWSYASYACTNVQMRYISSDGTCACQPIAPAAPAVADPASNPPFANAACSSPEDANEFAHVGARHWVLQSAGRSASPIGWKASFTLLPASTRLLAAGPGCAIRAPRALVVACQGRSCRSPAP